LPLTAAGKVSLIVTDMAVMEVTAKGLLLREIAADTSLEAVVKATEADLIVPENIGIFE
jgi:acetate CoA/acetoacetate CoA-transferase beta subunit